jgi:hypothetical protein
MKYISYQKRKIGKNPRVLKMKGKKLIKMINNKVKAIMTQSHKDDGDEMPTRMKLKSQTVQEYTWLPQAMLLPNYDAY